jgi:hypothetical protein
MRKNIKNYEAFIGWGKEHLIPHFSIIKHDDTNVSNHFSFETIKNKIEIGIKIRFRF